MLVDVGFKTFEIVFYIGVFHYVKTSESFDWLHAKELEVHMHWEHQIVY